MKYMMLILEQAGTREEFMADEQLMAEVTAIMAELEESGEMIGGQALADPSQSKVVRVKDGVTAVTDGPYVESKEYLGGYVILDCDEQRAIEIAARWPSRDLPMELRPIMDGGGEEM